MPGRTPSSGTAGRRRGRSRSRGRCSGACSRGSATPSRWRLRRYCGSVGILIATSWSDPHVVVGPPHLAERARRDPVVEDVFADALVGRWHRDSILPRRHYPDYSDGSRPEVSRQCVRSRHLLRDPVAGEQIIYAGEQRRRRRRKPRRPRRGRRHRTASQQHRLSDGVAAAPAPRRRRCFRAAPTQPMTKNVAHGRISTIAEPRHDPAACRRAASARVAGSICHQEIPAGDHRQRDQPADDLPRRRS